MPECINLNSREHHFPAGVILTWAVGLWLASGTNCGNAPPSGSLDWGHAGRSCPCAYTPGGGGERWTTGMHITKKKTRTTVLYFCLQQQRPHVEMLEFSISKICLHLVSVQIIVITCYCAWMSRRASLATGTSLCVAWSVSDNCYTVSIILTLASY